MMYGLSRSTLENKLPPLSWLGAVICFLFSIASLCLSVFSNSICHQDSFFRYLLGLTMVFIVPGYLLLVTLKPNELIFASIAKIVSLSFLLSLGFHIVLLPLLFFSHLSLKYYSLILATFCCVLSTKHLIQLKMLKSKADPGRERGEGLHDFGQLVFAIILSGICYRWGEDIKDIGGEKLLHFGYTINFFFGRLDIFQIGLTPGAYPQNFVNFSEFLLATAAWSSRIDPLILLNRARGIIPFFGFLSFFWLLEMLFPYRRKTNKICLIVSFLVVFDFILSHSPGLTFITDQDKTRGLMQWMGTIHHADSAMDILLPLSLGVLVFHLKRRNSFSALLLCIGLISSFLWHSREFFQVELYLGLAALFCLIWKNKNWVRSIRITGSLIFIFLFLCFLILAVGSLLPAGEQAGLYDEWEIKRKVLGALFGFHHILGIKPLLHNIDMPALNWPNTNKALGSTYALSFSLGIFLVSSVLLVVAGRTRERIIGYSFFALYFFTFCWDFSAMLIQIGTYSHFYMTYPRVYYLFGYISTGAATLLLLRLFSKMPSKLIFFLPFLGILISNIILFTLRIDSSHQLKISWIFTIILTLLILSKPFSRKYILRFSSIKGRNENLILVLILVGFFWCLFPSALKKLPLFAFFSRPKFDWYGDTNPFNLKRETIAAIQGLPELSVVATDPLENIYIPLYGKFFQTVAPAYLISTVEKDKQEQLSALNNEHPIFSKNPHLTKDLLANYLKNRGASYLFLRNIPTSLPLLNFVVRYPEDFELVFASPDRDQFLFKLKK